MMEENCEIVNILLINHMDDTQGLYQIIGEVINMALLTSRDGPTFRITGPFEVNAPVTSGFPSQKSGYAEFWCFLCL